MSGVGEVDDGGGEMAGEGARGAATGVGGSEEYWADGIGDSLK